jgi:hypothetical protein
LVIVRVHIENPCLPLTPCSASVAVKKPRIPWDLSRLSIQSQSFPILLQAETARKDWFRALAELRQALAPLAAR